MPQDRVGKTLQQVWKLRQKKKKNPHPWTWLTFSEEKQERDKSQTKRSTLDGAPRAKRQRITVTWRLDAVIQFEFFISSRSLILHPWGLFSLLSPPHLLLLLLPAPLLVNLHAWLCNRESSQPSCCCSCTRRRSHASFPACLTSRRTSHCWSLASTRAFSFYVIYARALRFRSPANCANWN